MVIILMLMLMLMILMVIVGVMMMTTMVIMTMVGWIVLFIAIVEGVGSNIDVASDRDEIIKED